MQYLQILLVILLFCIISYIGIKISIHKENLQNSEIRENYNNQLVENFVSELKADSDIHYLYWTGGFDSTYRLCEMLVNEGKTVQPIYVSLVLDNDCQSEESCNKLWLRRNRKEERLAMKKIKDLLNNKFPYTKKTLLPVLEVDQPINDDLFNHSFEKKFYSDNLWPRKRRKHQYLFLSKYAYYHKKRVDIGVLGIHEGSKFAQFLKQNLVKENNNYVVPITGHAISYLNFPLYGRSKEQLLEQSKQGLYDEILKESWSCWFPRNGKPCGKCPMCRERIVEHPKNDV